VANARTTLYAVMMVSLLGTAGIALPYPVLTPFFMEEGSDNAITQFLGLHPKILLGIILALYPVGLLIGSTFVGALSDLCGRKRVLIVTLLLAVASYGLTGYAVSLESYPLFALARLLTGLCESNIAVSRAIALDLHPAVDRTRAVSLVFAMNYAGWLVGPLAGAYLMPLGVDAVFYIAGLVTLVATFAVYVSILETTTDRAPAQGLWRAMIRHNSLSLLKVPSIRPLLAYHLLYTLGLNAFYEFYPLWMVESFGFGPEQIGWGTVAITVAMVVSSICVLTPLSRRFAQLTLVVVGSCTLGVLLMMLPLAGALSLYLVFAACGAIIGITNGIFPTYMANRFESYGQGRVTGLLASSFCVSNVIMALVGSFIALIGASWSLLSGGVICVLASVWLHQRVVIRDDSAADVISGEPIGAASESLSADG
jgi:MFS family permease